MNIKLTQTEAINMLRDHLRRTDVFSQFEPIQITIDEPAANPDYNKKTVELAPLVRAVLNPYLGCGSRKIQAIKAVRSELRDQGFEGGLADLKLFVEQFIP